MMEETSGFEGQQLFLALIPFCILIYFDFYILGAFYVLFLSQLLLHGLNNAATVIFFRNEARSYPSSKW